MNQNYHRSIRYFSTISIFLSVVLLTAAPASSNEYAALDGVDGIKAVFDVSLGSPARANVVFGAVRGVYTDKNTRSLSRPPKIAVVFRGPAVKLISTSREGFKATDDKALDAFAATIRQMKKDGVKLEVCDYALNVLGVDPASILPEVDHVGNGFISVIGFQAQGYSLVTID
jgi:intracellular sulfur oxidation DsrE/DsrF family protein